MGKQKQQVISRFFAPKPKFPSLSSSSSSSATAADITLPTQPFSPAKVSATVTFSPSKRLISSAIASQLTPPKSSKRPKLSPHTHNPLPSIPNPSLHQRFLDKFLEPTDDSFQPSNQNPRTSNGADPKYKYTPLEQQVVDLKKRYPDVLLMVEVGYRYRFFGQDAEIAARVLGIYAHLDHNFMTASIPTFRLNVHVRRLVSAGYKVGVVKQTETAAIKAHGSNKLGPFCRGLSALYTKATLEAAQDLGGAEEGCAGESNYLFCLVENSMLVDNLDCRIENGVDVKIGIVAMEISTGDVIYREYDDNFMRSGLEAMLLSLAPAELLLGDPISKPTEKVVVEVSVRMDVSLYDEKDTMEEGSGYFLGKCWVCGLIALIRDCLDAILRTFPRRAEIQEPGSLENGGRHSSRLSSNLLLLGYAGPASNVRVERASRDCFKNGSALAEVMSLYENIDQDNLTEDNNPETVLIGQKSDLTAIKEIVNMPNLALQAFALTIRHLKQFGLERVVSLASSFRPFSCKMEMTLSGNTLTQLEVLKNNDDGSETGSLLHCMNHTLTIFGSRLLRQWITHPLCDRNMIIARQEAVSEIAASMVSSKVSSNNGVLDEEDSDVIVIEPELNYILSSVLTTLGRAPDIQRGITRIFHRTAAPSEFIAVIQAILFAGKQLQQFHIDEEDDNCSSESIIGSKLLRKLILSASSSGLINIAAKLLSTISKEAADQGDFPNLMIIYSDQYPKVARARKEAQSAREKLDALITFYRKQLGMRNLEFTSVSGTTHLIELAIDVKVPSKWVKINSTKKTVRYHPPEVLAALDELSLANEELMVASRDAWDDFLRGFSRYYAEFQAAVQALASIDCLYSLAILSRNKNYARPEFVHDDEPAQIHICSGRHPVLEGTLQGNFVPNDTNLDANGEHCQIVTGPNMGGKSCYIRQVALIALMSQVGSFVPAFSAKLHVLDGIYTRMGASDSIQQGRSTFLEEMTETSHILRHSSSRSLVIIDELGRGTSTHDGVAIAYAALHNLLQQKKCLVLFVTHYPKVAEIAKEFPACARAYHVSYLTSHKNPSLSGQKSTEDVTYLYKLVPGVAESSFGFKVAQLAQIPLSCIARATEMGIWLEEIVARRAQHKSREHLPEISVKGLEWQSFQSFLERIDGYEEFFIFLKAIVRSADVMGTCCHQIYQARSMAMDLLGR
ncbi:DNA mismatch repair protein MSH3 [Cucumis melo var. makuwa]|uniref:DNA mismatch repair protein n=1 Tax=Cucumis melo var. makuwa TaxID=1194695 RepID=A0A5A7SWU6_CUCMM|nr:DNA mismatch repair protein MSH3 [Cucumis melo var. makuwa]TYK22934.1 DNA mismatch repair protein MSH3 [Cucumis melo var. makuwa]